MGVTSVLKDHGTEFLDAIKENEFNVFRDLCEKLLKYDEKISSLCTSDIKHKPSKKFACPLIMAARLEDPSIIKYMMERGVDPNFVHRTVYTSRRREMITALHIAVDLTLYKTVAILLNANANVNIPDHNGETSLMVAVKKSDWVMTQMLLSKGGNPSLVDSRGNSPLHVATLYGHLQLVKTLLKHDADAYQKGFMGAIASHIAAREGHIHLVQVFCSRDMGNINIKIPCFLDAREKAPIHLAAEHGHVETVVALLDQFKAEVNLRDSDGNTPLHCVVLNPYNAACMREKDYFYATVKILLKYRVRINEKNLSGNTALHLAAKHRYQKIVELLLSVGANCFAENDQRQKPIDVVPDSESVIRQLLKSAMLNPKQPIDISMLSLQNISFPLHTNGSPNHDTTLKANLSAIPPHLARNFNASRSDSSLSSVFFNNSKQHHLAHPHKSRATHKIHNISPNKHEGLPTYAKVRKKISEDSIYSSQNSIYNKDTLLRRGDTSRKTYSNSRSRKDSRNHDNRRSNSLEQHINLHRHKNEFDLYENLSFQSHQSPLATSERKKHVTSKEKTYLTSRNNKSFDNEKVKLVKIPGKPRTIEVEYSSGPITIELETAEDRLEKDDEEDSYYSSEDSRERNYRKEKERNLRNDKLRKEEKKYLAKDKVRQYESKKYDKIKEKAISKSIEDMNNINNDKHSIKSNQTLKLNDKNEPIYMNKLIAELHEKSGYLEKNIEDDEVFDDKEIKKPANKLNSSRENITKKDWQKLRQKQFDEDRMLEETYDVNSDKDDSLLSVDSDAFEDEKKQLKDMRQDSLKRAHEATESLKLRWSQDEDEIVSTNKPKAKSRSKKKDGHEPIKPPRPSLIIADLDKDSQNNLSATKDNTKDNKFESEFIEHINDKILRMQTLVYIMEPKIPPPDETHDQKILATDFVNDEILVEASDSEEPLPSAPNSKSHLSKGLNMRVTGEVPKAYTRKDIDSAKKAFILHPPVGIESSSEASDASFEHQPNNKQHKKWGKVVPIIYSNKTLNGSNFDGEKNADEVSNNSEFNNAYHSFDTISSPNVCNLVDAELDEKNLNQYLMINNGIKSEFNKNNLKNNSKAYVPLYPESYEINSDESINSLENESFDEYSDENYSVHRKRSSLRQALNYKISKERSDSRDRTSNYSNENLNRSINSSMENIKEYKKMPFKKSIKVIQAGDTNEDLLEPNSNFDISLDQSLDQPVIISNFSRSVNLNDEINKAEEQDISIKKKKSKQKTINSVSGENDMDTLVEVKKRKKKKVPTATLR